MGRRSRIQLSLMFSCFVDEIEFLQTSGAISHLWGLRCDFCGIFDKKVLINQIWKKRIQFALQQLHWNDSMFSWKLAKVVSFSNNTHLRRRISDNTMISALEAVRIKSAFWNTSQSPWQWDQTSRLRSQPLISLFWEPVFVRITSVQAENVQPLLTPTMSASFLEKAFTQVLL